MRGNSAVVLLAVVFLGLSLVVATGAVTVSEEENPNVCFELQATDSPYAYGDDDDFTLVINEEATEDSAGDGANVDAVSEFDDVFIIENTSDDDVILEDISIEDGGNDGSLNDHVTFTLDGDEFDSNEEGHHVDDQLVFGITIDGHGMDVDEYVGDLVVEVTCPAADEEMADDGDDDGDDGDDGGSGGNGGSSPADDGDDDPSDDEPADDEPEPTDDEPADDDSTDDQPTDDQPIDEGPDDEIEQPEEQDDDTTVMDIDEPAPTPEPALLPLPGGMTSWLWLLLLLIAALLGAMLVKRYLEDGDEA